jgi:hypothetical protein
MQRDGKSGGNGVAALRERMRAASAANTSSLASPPKKKSKHETVDARDERAERAERLAQAQHQTSLLTKAPKNDRLKPVKKKTGTPFLLQLLLVAMVAGGVAVALDPTLMAQARAYVEPHIDTVREMLNV